MSNPSQIPSPRILLTPAQAAARFVDGAGEPVISEGWLATLRYEDKARKPHERKGPPYVKPSTRVFYPLAEFEAWVMQWAGGQLQARGALRQTIGESITPPPSLLAGMGLTAKEYHTSIAQREEAAS